MFGRDSRKATIALAGLALVAASCIADDQDPLGAELGPGDEVTMLMSEFAFMPSNLVVVAGSTVTITLSNEGAVPHEFMVGSQNIEGGGYAEDLLGQMLVDAHGFGFTQVGLALGGDHDEDPADDHAEDSADDPADDPADDHAEDPADDHDEDPAAGHDDDMSDDDMSDMGEGDGGHGHEGAAITVEPGGEVTIVLNIPSDATGDWEIGCFIEGHYEAGMHGTLAVSQSNT